MLHFIGEDAWNDVYDPYYNGVAWPKRGFYIYATSHQKEESSQGGTLPI